MNHDEAEHASGLRPIGDYPDHCRVCRDVAARRQRQDACEHHWETLEFHNQSGDRTHVRTYCSRCGLADLTDWKPKRHAAEPNGRCYRHDYAHREYVCTCDPPVADDTGWEW